MNVDTEHLVELFRTVNNGTINLVDSLSVYSALAELNNKSLSEKEFFSHVLQILLEHKGIEGAALFMKKEEQMQLECRAGWGRSSISVEHDIKNDMAFFPGDGFVEKSAETGTIIHQQCNKLPGFLIQCEDDHPDSEHVIGVRMPSSSLMCVPLKNHNVVCGVLCLYHPKNDYFNITHEHFFSLYAQLLTQVLLNNRYANGLEEALKKAADLQRDMRGIALMDQQTGLPTRQFFCVESQAALARSNRHGRDFSCCVLEICDFKNLIDEKGLFAGDQILEIVADILKLQVREGDILAYLRGEQFILALPEVDEDGARLFAERILNVVSKARQEVDGLALLELNIGLSTNNAILSESTQAAMEELMYQADRALQAGKLEQRNICHFNEKKSADASLHSA
ncbi:MAG: sensor domain-containing diguanylate cyclase [Gammaproteobacteria bacterium]|nr:sensor domain-containing diguanylate cyclase [Gammaproteobacteria bacterium]